MDKPSSFDNTMLVTYQSCPRKFYLFWAGLEPISEPPYFTVGKIWQNGLQVWYTSKGDTAYRLGEALTFMERAWADSGAIGTDYNNVEILKFLMTMYAIEYDEEPWEIVLYDGKMELGFEVPIPGTYYNLSGAIDGYINWKGYGKLVLENKTAGLSIGESYLRQWSFSSQVTQYFWGLSQILGELPFGVLMNCASKRISKKAMDEFQRNLTIPEGIFARSLEKRSLFKMNEFEREVTLQIENLLAEFDRKIWPKTRNPIECVGGIGKSPCFFKRLCLLDDYPWNLDKGTLLGSDLKFREGPWQPWKRGQKGASE